MGKKNKKKEASFNIQTLIRIIIFAALVYFLIAFFLKQQESEKNLVSKKVLGEKSSDPTLLKTEEKKPNEFGKRIIETANSVYNLVPESNRKQIENINQTPFILSISKKIGEIQEQGQKSFDIQIKNFKKEIAKRVYDQVVKNIDSETKP